MRLAAGGNAGEFFDDGELERQLLEEFPTPLADLFDDLTYERSPRGQLAKVIDLFRAGVRLLAFYALAATDDKELAPEALARLHKLQRQRLSEGDWLGLAREAVRPFTRAPALFPLGELAAVFFRPGSDRPSPDAAALDRLLKTRNEWAHGVSGTDAEVAAIVEQCRPDLETMARLLRWMADAQWFVPEAAGEGRVPTEGGWEGRRLVGTTPRRGFRSASITTSERLEAGKVYLLGPAGSLCLSPLVQFLAPPEEASEGEAARAGRRAGRMETADPELFLFEACGRRAAQLQAFPSGREVESPEAQQWLQDRLARAAEPAEAAPARLPPPTGTVTFLLCEWEGPGAPADEQLESARDALARQEELFSQVIAGHDGYLFSTTPGASGGAFASAARALEAALALQRAAADFGFWVLDLGLEERSEAPEASVPLEPPANPKSKIQNPKSKVALHTGTAELRDGEYFGAALERVSRLLEIAHGGQVLVSQATYGLACDLLPAGMELQDLGAHRLKDLQRPERLYQLRHPELKADFPPLKTLDRLPNNLPQQLTSFIGREREIADVQRLLSETRLLTLMGTGGCGKTRLALQVAANHAAEYPDGVWLVELAPLADPALVPQSVAAVLGVRDAGHAGAGEDGGHPLLSTLAEYLQSRRLLLVLDNCEHVVAACASLAHTLLAACPGLQILATSREALRVPGETIKRVPSLSLPALPRPLPAPAGVMAAITDCESVRLFVDRSLAVHQSFQLTERTAPYVAQVCRLLDGIPLAIELAAARVKALSVDQIAERLDDRFRLLTGGSRTVLPRQQTLRALVDWSYDLLSNQERLLWQRLSVFAGGFTLAAAEAICAGEGVEEYEVLDLLEQLLDKSLVIAEEQEERRYRLLETIRQYGLERLRGSAEEVVLRDRHQHWFLQFAEAAEPKLGGPEQAVWLERLEEEHDNLRAALTWAKERVYAEAALRMGGALWRFWSERGYLSEGWEQLAQIRALPGADARTAAAAKARIGAGALAHDQGNLPAARALFQESLAIGRELDNPGLEASALLNLGLAARDQGDYAGARSLFEQSLAIDEKLGNQWGVARSLMNLGCVAADQGDYAAARSLYEKCLAIQRALGDRWGIAASLNNLGNVAHNQGDLATAHAFCEQSLAIWRELAVRREQAYSLLNLGLIMQERGEAARAAGIYAESLALFQELGAEARRVPGLGDQNLQERVAKSGIAAGLKELAGVAGSAGQPERAVPLFAAAHALREAMGTPLPPSDCATYERQLDAVRSQLGEEAYAAAWAAGLVMSVEQALAGAAETAERLRAHSAAERVNG